MSHDRAPFIEIIRRRMLRVETRLRSLCNRDEWAELADALTRVHCIIHRVHHRLRRAHHKRWGA